MWGGLLIIKVNWPHLSLKLCLDIRDSFGNVLHVIAFDLSVWGKIMNHDLFDHGNIFATWTQSMNQLFITKINL